MGPASDCELISAGFLGQPVNSLTTFAFLAGGIIVMGVTRRLWMGAALIATGVGSFLFHGPMPPGSQWAHDVTLAWLILTIAGIGTRWERSTRLPGLAVLGLLFAMFPVAADWVAVMLVVLALGVHLVVRTPNTIPVILFLGVFAVVGRLGTTGGPLCDPSSLVQPHGLWHVGAAVVVTWWVTISEGAKSGWPEDVD